MKIKGYFNIYEKKVLYSLGILILLGCINLYNQFLKNAKGLSFNFYDYIIYVFNNIFFIFGLIFVIVVVCVYKIINKDTFTTYFVFRFHSKTEFIINIFLYVLVFNFMLIAIILLLSFLLVGFPPNAVNYNNVWSPYGINEITSPILRQCSPMVLALRSIASAIVYLFTVSSIMVVGSMYIKKTIIIVLVVMGGNFLSKCIYLNKYKMLYPISFIHNALINYQVNLNPVLFWGSLLTLIILLSMLRIKKLEF